MEVLRSLVKASPLSEHASVEEKEAELRHQEAALIKLGELYRDQKYALRTFSDIVPCILLAYLLSGPSLMKSRMVGLLLLV